MSPLSKDLHLEPWQYSGVVTQTLEHHVCLNKVLEPDVKLTHFTNVLCVWSLKFGECQVKFLCLDNYLRINIYKGIIESPINKNCQLTR